jgi:hypothetical protein
MCYGEGKIGYGCVGCISHRHEACTNRTIVLYSKTYEIRSLGSAHFAMCATWHHPSQTLLCGIASLSSNWPEPSRWTDCLVNPTTLAHLRTDLMESRRDVSVQCLHLLREPLLFLYEQQDPQRSQKDWTSKSDKLAYSILHLLNNSYRCVPGQHIRQTRSSGVSEMIIVESVPNQ